MKILTGGTFNRLHPGHKYLLKKCKELGYLVVVLAHDVHNKKPNTVNAKTRKENVEKLGIADKVVIGHPDSFVQTVYDEKPDVIALGYDQKMPADITDEVLQRMKIKVIRMKKFGDY